MPAPSGKVSLASMAGYSGTPLAKKLGIKEDHRVVLLEAPADFETQLAPLPEGASCVRGFREDGDAEDGNQGDTYPVILLFSTAAEYLRQALPRAVRHLPADGGLWVAWPKKASKMETDLAFDGVQRAGLELGLVDNKVCAVDETWSGLRFVVRKEDRADWPSASGENPP